jgi:hypothetical protein
VATGGVPSAAGFVVPHALSAVPAVNTMKAHARTCFCRRVESVMCFPSIAMSSCSFHQIEKVANFDVVSGSILTTDVESKEALTRLARDSTKHDEVDTQH